MAVYILTKDMLKNGPNKLFEMKIPTEIGIYNSLGELLWAIEIEQINPFNRFYSKMRITDAVLENPNNGRLYHTRPNSIEDIKLDPRMLVEEDTRYRLFDSREHYKSVYNLLIKAKLDDSISEGTFLGIHNKINDIYDELYKELLKSTIFFRWFVIKDFKEELDSEPAVKKFIDRARNEVQISYMRFY